MKETKSKIYGMVAPIFSDYDSYQLSKIKNFMINNIINNSDLFEKCFINKNERGLTMINLRVKSESINTDFNVETIFSFREIWFEDSNRERLVKNALKNFVNKTNLLDYCRTHKINRDGCELLKIEIEVLYDC